MAKKSERAEPKKECPSCGLGVTEQAMVCEFCGWDFNEEDEWILQIEKLERDLMLEKQRYEPGTVNHMIESTLRSTVGERIESSTPASEESIDIEEPEALVEEVETEEQVEERPTPPVREEEPVGQMAPAPEAPKVRRVRSVKEAPQPARAAPPVSEPREEPPPRQRTVRRVKTDANAPVHADPEPEPDVPKRKTRVVRKVKQ